MKRRGRVEILEISKIVRTTDTGILVVIEATGKTAWLPRMWVDFLPRRAVVPDWLARKIMKGEPCR